MAGPLIIIDVSCQAGNFRRGYPVTPLSRPGRFGVKLFLYFELRAKRKHSARGLL